MAISRRALLNGLTKLNNPSILNIARTITSLRDCYYNAEQQEIQKTVTKIIEEHVIPYYDEWEEQKIFPAHKIFKIFGDAGLLGINKPVEFGGLGLDYKYNLAAIEALGQVPGYGIPLALTVHTDMATPALTKFGSDALRREFLVPSISGDVVTSIGVTEPTAGSDVAAIKTTARRQGDDYIINGQKLWITNFSQSDWICLLANTSDGHRHKNKSLICVPMDTEGITRGKKLNKLGLHCSDTGPIFFEDVRVPAKNLIGEEGKGFLYLMLQFQEERLAGSATVVGLIDQVLKRTIEYTGQRMVYGKRVLDQQHIQFRLAELSSEIESDRALMYSTTDSYLAGHDSTMLISMLKLKLGRLSRVVSDSCLQMWGAMGYSEDMAISRLYRDLRVSSIGAGVDEVMLTIISKEMGLMSKEK